MLRRVALAVVESPGVVGSAEVYNVESNETLTLEAGEGFLVFNFSAPASVWLAVEDSGGSQLLRVAVKVKGLLVPQSLLGGVDYSPSHTFLRVNFTLLPTLDSPAGFRLSATVETERP